jgi:GR25 family glycosyltransferase involved in LPS biosynthesis
MELIKYCHIINLDKRPDRLQSAKIELSKLNIIPIRIPAIYNENGSIGCAQSHIISLKKAIDENYPYLFVVEDDIKILDENVLKEKLNIFHNSNVDWDVLLLGGINYKPYTEINENYIKISNTQLAHAYILKNIYFTKLLASFEKSYIDLQNNIHKSAIDQYWKILQKTDNWYMIIPINVIQYPNYSDISKKYMDYVNRILKS